MPKSNSFHFSSGSHRKKYSFVKIMTGSDLSSRKLPQMSLTAKEDGPCLWLTACSHGDEVGGMVVIQELFRHLLNRPMRGRLYAFPLMNPLGFENVTRHITLSEEDLNRSFPGRRGGSLGERIADRIFGSITGTNPDLVVDLHNDCIKSVPYALLDETKKEVPQGLTQRLEEMALASGLIVIKDDELISSSLSHCLLLEGIPSLTLELGESYVVNEDNIQVGVGALLNLMEHLEMIPPQEAPYHDPLTRGVRVLSYCDRPSCSTSGLLRPLAHVGSWVKQGQVLAKIYNPFGKLKESLKAPAPGLLLTFADSSFVFPGMKVLSLGLKQPKGQAPLLQKTKNLS